MIEIRVYKEGVKADFYIQSHGDKNAGRPLKEPTRNCFAVKTDIPCAYDIIYVLWKGKMFNNLIIGSVIPFIRLCDIKPVLREYFLKQYCSKKINAINQIANLIEEQNKKVKLLEEYRFVLAVQTVKEAL